MTTSPQPTPEALEDGAARCRRLHLLDYGYVTGCDECEAITAALTAALPAIRAEILNDRTTTACGFDPEQHAMSYNQGYEEAVAQHLTDDPSLAADWLAERDAAIRAEVLAEVEELRVAATHLLWFFDVNDIFEDGAFNPPTLGEARGRIERLHRAVLAPVSGAVEAAGDESFATQMMRRGTDRIAADAASPAAGEDGAGWFDHDEPHPNRIIEHALRRPLHRSLDPVTLVTPVAGHEQEVRAEAWDEGARAAGGYGHEDGWTHDMSPLLDNPYRALANPTPDAKEADDVVQVRMLHRTPNHSKGQIGTLHDASPTGHVNLHTSLKWVDYGKPIQWSHGQSESTGEWCVPGEYEVVAAKETDHGK